MFLKTKTKIYKVNFGLSGLKLYSEYSNQIAEQDKTHFLLYCGLISSYPDITFDEINDIISQCDLSELAPPIHLSPFNFTEFYTKAVGEIGIEPVEALRMTPDEIDSAYEGYLRKQETTANLTKLAIAQALSGNNDLIRLTEDKGYIIGTEEERKATFEKLGI